ncbi:MAG: UDP-glucose 4-epimerase GalE [Saprospiraceae bacterium]|nr:UDP-glucose 4-epimerase GalE [Saprospiraceae bacterium]
MKKILVTGGCGYIGSHTLVDLLEQGYDPISIDNLVNADEAILDNVAAITGRRVPNYRIDLCEEEALRSFFRQHDDIEGVIHFAALKSVGESVEQPLRYYRNNVLGMVNLLENVRELQISSFIFSSSCSVYGNADELPVTETTPFGEAESPYARTKQIGEQLIHDLARATAGTRFVLLRYFNPAGAHDSGRLGEAPINPASNLVPVITEAAIGKRKELVVFGDDYPTRDGSCVRDYIHIMDLADAHTKALKFLIEGKNAGQVETFNLGIGEGVSVLEAVHAFEESTGEKLPYRIGPRRPGDVDAVYASNERAARLLDWRPQRDIAEIMRTAWEWEKVR